MAEDKIRTFLAVPFSETYQAEFERLLKAFESHAREIKFVNPAQVHLTIYFFGSIEPARIESLKIFFRNLASRFRPFEVHLKDMGAFPNFKRPRVLWVGLAGEIQELKNLKEACDLELVRLGFAIEEREFKPHLTLGRVKEGSRLQIELPGYLQNYVHEKKHRIHEIVLYQSQLTPKGPVYTPIERFEFRA